MPALCIFYGIIVRMYKEKGGKHNKPHIHAEYQGQEIVAVGTCYPFQDAFADLQNKLPKKTLKFMRSPSFWAESSIEITLI